MNAQIGSKARVMHRGAERAAQVVEVVDGIKGGVRVRLWGKRAGGAPKLNQTVEFVPWGRVVEVDGRRANPAPGCEAVEVRAYSRKPKGGRSTGRCPARRSAPDRAAGFIDARKASILAGKSWGEGEQRAAMLDAEVELMAAGASQRAARQAVTRAARQAQIPEAVIKGRHRPVEAPGARGGTAKKATKPKATRKPKAARKPKAQAKPEPTEPAVRVTRRRRKADPEPVEPTAASKPKRRSRRKKDSATLELFSNGELKMPANLEHMDRVVLGFEGQQLVDVAAVRQRDAGSHYRSLAEARSMAGGRRFGGSRRVVATVNYRWKDSPRGTPAPVRCRPTLITHGERLVVGVADGAVSALHHIPGSLPAANAVAQSAMAARTRYVLTVDSRYRV